MLATHVEPESRSGLPFTLSTSPASIEGLLALIAFYKLMWFCLMIGIVIDVLERAQLKTLHSLLDKAILRKLIPWLHIGICYESGRLGQSAFIRSHRLSSEDPGSSKADNVDLKLADILRYKMFTSGNIFQFKQMFWATPYAEATPDLPCCYQENLL